jgi:type I restriction enzyme M protein
MFFCIVSHCRINFIFDFFDNHIFTCLKNKRIAGSQLWGIANLLRGKISADDYRDYILGFIFYKYLSEKQLLYANGLLEGEEVTDYNKVTDEETLQV